MRHLAIAVIALFGYIQYAAAGEYYTLDPDQTHVKFATKMCEADILTGEFHNVAGTLYFDETKPERSKVEVTIDPASASYSREYHKEDHIKTVIEGEKILNTKQFPQIAFTGTKIEKTSDITGILTGNMTMMGQTRPLQLEVTFHNDVGMTTKGREVVAFSAYGTFKRSDWGINYGLDRIGIRRMGDEVIVLISATANRNKK